MRISISDIKVRKRIRRESGDIDSLVESLNQYGLLNPIVLSQNYELIAGFRRLDAAKKLGWETIPATIIEASDKITRLELELEENVQRLDFTDEELLDGFTALEKLKNPTLFRRIWSYVKDFFTYAFDKQEARKTEKKRKNALLSLLMVLAIALMIFTSVLYKNALISAILLSLLNVVSFIILLVGLFFFVRFCRGIEFKN